MIDGFCVRIEPNCALHQHIVKLVTYRRLSFERIRRASQDGVSRRAVFHPTSRYPREHSTEVSAEGMQRQGRKLNQQTHQ
jgi:hypothetical protein